MFPDPILIDGQTFDPAAHFQNWRKRQAEWSAGKTARLTAALARATDLRAAGPSIAKAAATLNAEGLQSPTGKPWTADNLRKPMLGNDLHRSLAAETYAGRRIFNHSDPASASSAR